MKNFIVLFFVLTLSCAAPKAEKKGQKNSSNQLSKDECICMMIYEPVCDKSSQKTYSNACEARCNNVKRFKPGACSID